MRRSTLLASGLAGAAGLMIVSCAEVPDAPESDDQIQAHLEEFLEENSGAFEEGVAVVVDGDELHWAAAGQADLQSVFEVASLSKPLTGMLLADAVDRGEVGLDDELGEHLPDLAGTAAGSVTLEELATHTSGLPLVPTAGGFADESDALRGQSQNPYPITADELIELAAGQDLGAAGSYLYSNMGVSLLGHALAEQAGVTYEDLLAQRLTGPLGMDRTFTSHHQGHESDELLLPGHDRSGEEAESFASEAFSPSSSVRSSAGDYAALIQAINDGEAPGLAAIESSDLDANMGLGWVVEADFIWHNGISNGYASIVFIAPEEDLGVVVFSNLAYQNTHLGRQLIDSLR
ncbi:serine hydrolase domain-containing protein [Nesterenkonia muleiensis]|uniref:serine hydrolase domain-containing protein n=1 Tax=Nesterenkonia muleiensis TaxID=2282648 RepID=UPI001300AC6E|nr:serine hydrolase domain-containing protein [Nesterenkonia muleiensis]